MLIAMAGLPATGKSTIAARLEKEIGAVVLNKDQVRAALFPPPVLDYSTVQDDISMAAMYNATAYILRTFHRQGVIIDGRTFTRSYQVHELYALAKSWSETPLVIECFCEQDVARERLEKDLAQGRHSAANRTYAHYFALEATAEPLVVPRLVLDTGRMSLEECVERSLDFVRSSELSSKAFLPPGEGI